MAPPCAVWCARGESLKFANVRWDGVQPCARACGIKKETQRGERERERGTETKHDTPRKFTRDVPVALENTSFSICGSRIVPRARGSCQAEVKKGDRRGNNGRDEKEKSAFVYRRRSLAFPPPSRLYVPRDCRRAFAYGLSVEEKNRRKSEG